MDVYDVNFKDLVKEPVQTVASIYERFGLDASSSLAKHIHRYLQNHPRDEYGIHEYSLERYGLDSQQLYKDYSHYIELFNVPLERNDRNAAEGREKSQSMESVKL